MRCPICAVPDSQPVWKKAAIRIEKCGSCGVFFTAERPQESALMQLYNGDALLVERPDPLPKGEDLFPPWKMQEHQKLLDEIATFGVTAGSLLDVGCFSGMFLTNARKRGFEVAGIEPNQDAFAHVRNLLGCEVVHGSLASAHFPPGHFSAVSFLDVIEHVKDPVADLKVAFRIMRPGGVLVLATPNVKGLLQQVVKSKRNILRQPWCPIDDVPWHLWGFTRKSLTLCVEKAGFLVKKISWLEPSPLSTNLGAGSSALKRASLWAVAQASKRLGLSDRMVLFAQKPESA
ncbi:MAG TPA: class I SAM-dependent methyltransferase [Candidatus Dormibacteraeota bacterium]|nr:class I SAM-dependent methyltransferase [Candidatus Dormibacteraeota bacterium]